MSRTITPLSLPLLFLTVAFAGATRPAIAQDVPWRSPWTINAPLQFRSAAFSSDGEVVLADVVSPDLRLTRLTAAGTVRWSNNLHVSASLPGTLLAASDGSAFTNVGGGQVSRIGADGNVAWQRSLPASSLTQVSAQRLGVLGPNDDYPVAHIGVAVLDAATGATLWATTTAVPAAQGLANALSSDAQGNLYALMPSSSSYRIAKFKPDGNLQWSQSYGGSGATSIGYGNNAVFVMQTGMLSAYGSSDGAALWTFSDTPRSLTFFAGDPVFTHDDIVERRAAQSGSVVWSAQVPGIGATTSSGYVVNSASEILATSRSNASSLTRIDGASGAILGSTPLPIFFATNAIQAFPIATGILGTGTAAVVGQNCPNALCTAMIARVALDDGSPQGTSALPNTVQGIAADTIDDGSNGVIGAAFLPDGLHLRHLTHDGTLSWEVTDVGNWLGSDPLFVTPVATDSVVAVARTSSSSLWVGAYARNDGHRLWQKLFLPQSSQIRLFDQYLLADSAGDFVLATAGISPCCYLHGGQTVMKLSGTDGTLRWRRDADRPNNSAQAVSPTLNVSGDNAFVFAPFETTPVPATLVKLSGNDGSTLWSSSYAVASALTTHDGNLLTGNGVDYLKINSTDGSVIWTEPGGASCGTPCFSPEDFQEAANGDTVLAGNSNDPFSDLPGEPWLAIFRGDGSGMAYQGNPFASDGLLGNILQVLPGSAGRTWLRLKQYSASYHGMVWLSELDPASHHAKSNQLVTLSGPTDAFTANGGFLLLANPAADRFLLTNYEVTTNVTDSGVDTLLDTHITANGDLAIAIDSAKTLQNGLSHFQVTVRYSGDVALSGVKIYGILPLPLAAAPACTTNAASNCLADALGDHLHASFDIAPGGSVTLTADMPAASQQAPLVTEAWVYGPVGLNESLIGNNLATGHVADGIFASRFE